MTFGTSVTGLKKLWLPRFSTIIRSGKVNTNGNVNEIGIVHTLQNCRVCHMRQSRNLIVFKNNSLDTLYENNRSQIQKKIFDPTQNLLPKNTLDNNDFEYMF